MSQDDDELNGSDPFLARVIFPDAASVFGFRPEPLSEAKAKAIVVLDTNVLLVPYTISPKTLREIGKTYTTLKSSGRLVVPAQVAREFAKHRATKLSELYHQLSTKRSGLKFLQLGQYPLFENVAEYQQVSELEKAIDASLRKYLDANAALLERVRTWNWDDPVSVLYSKLFTPDVVLEAAIEEAELRRDFDDRCKAKIPPGYKDAGKDINAAGDLIIWHTILELGEARKLPVILVSGDGKPDWWHKSGGQPLYPRYELTDEFRRRSDGQSFYITKFSDFLDLYGAKQDVVAEVRKEEDVVQTSSEISPGVLRRIRRRAEGAVFKWLVKTYPGARVEPWRRGDADFVVAGSGTGMLGVEVIFSDFPKSVNVVRRLREVALRAYWKSGYFSDYLICVINATEDGTAGTVRAIRRVASRIPPVTISVGLLEPEGYLEIDRVRTSGEGRPERPE